MVDTGLLKVVSSTESLQNAGQKDTFQLPNNYVSPGLFCCSENSLHAKYSRAFSVRSFRDQEAQITTVL